MGPLGSFKFLRSKKKSTTSDQNSEVPPKPGKPDAQSPYTLPIPQGQENQLPAIEETFTTDTGIESIDRSLRFQDSQEKPSSSRSRSGNHDAGDQDYLWGKIWTLLADSTYDGGTSKKFLPEGSLPGIFTEDAVRQTLGIEEDHGSQELQSLIVFVTAECRKILATWLYDNVRGRELARRMRIFQQEGYYDGNLPLKQSDRIFWKNEVKPRFIAVKKMIPDDPKTLAKDWWKEVYALERLKPKKHKHIVRFITGICFEGIHDADYIMMFEWADGGNLQNLWERSPQKPTLSAIYIKEACEQIHGLADALGTAHYLDTANRYSIRHGDLKPANILCFTSHGHFPTLKIADWGLAKEHSQPTEFRLYASTARYGTKRYEAPEVKKALESEFLTVRNEREAQDPRSRLSDIWAMGCIALEFLIWLLYGYDELARFKKTIPDRKPFFETVNGSESLLPVVQKWINHMEQEPLCGKGTALGDLLECIQHGLLVFNLPPGKGSNPSAPSKYSSDKSPNDSDSSIDADNFHLEVTPAERAAISTNGAKQSDPSARQEESFSEYSNASPGPKIPEIKFIRARTQTMNSSFEPGKNSRILAGEFATRMKEILQKDADSNRDYWYLHSERVPPQNETVTASLHEGQATPEVRRAINLSHLQVSGASEVKISS
ncbi:hypothetical protein SLS60_005763 [Paraconiothyrium brasiliense]|uniref:Protein kinase domain-containing protein n=1 Tax=Paraconiothyrium brasiliense TaxID=300254 RepID=A0ABR3RDA7_9PLEO